MYNYVFSILYGGITLFALASLYMFLYFVYGKMFIFDRTVKILITSISTTAIVIALSYYDNVERWLNNDGTYTIITTQDREKIIPQSSYSTNTEN